MQERVNDFVEKFNLCEFRQRVKRGLSPIVNDFQHITMPFVGLKRHTPLAESLRCSLDKSGKRRRLCRHLQTPLICRSFRDLDESGHSRP